jgi:acylphosphatase
MGRDAEPLVAKRWIVAGRVQGVGFRYFVQSTAAALKLRGFTRNLGDGRVEVYAVGQPAKLSDLAAALHRGPRLAQVRSVEEQEDVVKNLTGFIIR